MNIDEQIQQALHNEAKQLDDIIAHEPGLFNRLGNVYKSSTRVWVGIASIGGFIATAAFLYFGYLFYVAVTVDDRVFWAVWFLVCFIAQVAIKQWIFMEMNRTSTLREVKRVEIAIERLQNLIISQNKK